MSNAKTFLWLFAYVQLGFISLDLFEHWYCVRRAGIRQLFRKNLALICGIAMACVAYFGIQLALASTLPALDKLTALASRFSSTHSAGASRAWTVPIFLAAFFTGTFFDYLVHRFLLHGPLWRLHENHHLPAVVSNVMPGIVARPFVVVPNFVINICSCCVLFGLVQLIGRPELIATFIYVMPALLLSFAFVASASHSIFLRRFALLDKGFRCMLLLSPREHLVHHAATLKGNYGNFTAVWDRLFGTYISPSDAGGFALGLQYDQDFLGAITAGRLKLSGSARSRYQVGRVCRLRPETDGGTGDF
jgi:sterol desaturase/sphingolipid hydroxylase (fatty acid hydroxylase superfamily)